MAGDIIGLMVLFLSFTLVTMTSFYYSVFRYFANRFLDVYLASVTVFSKMVHLNLLSVRCMYRCMCVFTHACLHMFICIPLGLFESACLRSNVC